MKPKISTGYLTPQAKKTTKQIRNRLSDTEENEAENGGFNEDLFQALMKCPEKKNMVLRLLAANKEAINEYTQKERRKSAASPLAVVKSKSKTCESPTALLRRRALEQMNSSSSTSNKSNIARPKSTSSYGSSHTSSPVPFDKVLDGVIAYVEIKNRQDEDRSAGAKAVLKSMGALVRDRFSKDVTHVIFKDGSYSTFQKAKLLKVHLVSILWVEFCRKTMQRQSEKQYPAMKSGFDDETLVCSQMHKEYEDIIREEYRRSIVQGTPLPTTKSLVNRRRTLMTPSCTNVNGSSSSSTFRTAAESVLSQDISDREVEAINGFNHDRNTINDELIMNDPDCFSQVAQSDVVQPVLKSVENIMDCSDMELTNIVPENRHLASEKDLSNSEIIKENPKKLSRDMSKSLFDRRKTISSSLISSDLSADSRISIDKSINETSLVSSDKSTDVSNLEGFVVPKAKSIASKRFSRSASNLVESNESFIFGHNRVKPKQTVTTEVEKTSSAMSELKLSSEKNEAEASTSMSNLQVVSSDLSSSSAPKKHQNKAGGSSMSVLQVSSENVKATGSLMSCLEISDSNVVPPKSDQGKSTNIKHEFVTVRNRSGLSSASKSFPSDDSEIISPRKSIRKKVCNNRSDVAGKNGELKKLTRKKLTYDSINTEPPKPPQKQLVVNVEKAPLCDIQIKDQRKTRSRTLAPKPKEITTSTEPKRTEEVQKSNSSSTDSDNTDSVKSRRKFRKLYNPDDSIRVELDDEKEREEKRKKARKRKSDEVYINPIEMVKATDKTHPEVVTSESDTNDDVTTSLPKRTRKANKKKSPPTPRISLNSSADEQKELLKEVLNRKPPAAGSDKKTSPLNKPETTISRRKSTRIVEARRNKKDDDIPCTPVNRRSTMEFMSRSQLTSSRKTSKKKVDKTKLPTIVCTKLHKPEVQVFAQIVKKLGRFNIEDEVSDKTTHLVAGEAKRTINMLRAISRGCWVVSYEWVLSSLEEGKWLPEEKYEVTDFSPAVQKCRLERQAFGAKYRMDVFESCPAIYVSLSTNPRCSDLKELITVCKGKVVNVPRMAKIVVGQYLEQAGTVCVNETWVLDCITFYRKMPFKEKYLMRSRRTSVEV